MVSLRQKRFCCCCDLRTGSLIVGTLGWIITLMQIFVALDPPISKQESVLNEDDSEGNILIKAMVTASQRQNVYSEVAIGILVFLICVMLVWGVYKRDTRFMLPWLVLKAMQGVVLILVTILLLIIVFLVSEHAAILILVIDVIAFIATVLEWYCWLCVWSHYKEIEESRRNETSGHYTSSPPPAYYNEEKQQMMV